MTVDWSDVVRFAREEFPKDFVYHYSCKDPEKLIADLWDSAHVRNSFTQKTLKPAYLARRPFDKVAEVKLPKGYFEVLKDGNIVSCPPDAEPEREISEAEMLVLAEVKTVAAEKLAALKSEVYRIGKSLLQRTLAAWPRCESCDMAKALEVTLVGRGARIETHLSCKCGTHVGPYQLTPLHVQRAFVAAGSPVLVVSE